MILFNERHYILRFCKNVKFQKFISFRGCHNSTYLTPPRLGQIFQFLPHIGRIWELLHPLKDMNIWSSIYYVKWKKIEISLQKWQTLRDPKFLFSLYTCKKKVVHFPTYIRSFIWHSNQAIQDFPKTSSGPTVLCGFLFWSIVLFSRLFLTAGLVRRQFLEPLFSIISEPSQKFSL